MWMVWSNDSGLIVITNNKVEAMKEYEKEKQWYKYSFDHEFYGDKRIVLAKVERDFYSHDTGNPVIDYDDEGNEVERNGETYWDWKEDFH